MSERESLSFDVLIVGAGPAGLATAIRLAQLAQAQERELEICVLEKGSVVGAHILSGAVVDPRALAELFPDWQAQGAPLECAVTRDETWLLSGAQRGTKMPNALVPASMHNQGNYIASVGRLCAWLGEQAEALGVQVFPGFPAAEILYSEDGAVAGVRTADMGLHEDGTQKPGYEPGMDLFARCTVFAEGSRGHLGKQLISRFELDTDATPQHYAIGLKEIWEIPEDQHEPGLVVHGAGWPLSENGASGGWFLYHGEGNQVLCGLIVDLNYSHPNLSPFDEFQRLKHHPVFSRYLKGGTRISYGARAITKGGLNSLPKMVFPGGLLIGCDAGTLDFSRIKGTHTAMKSGMLAAESVFAQLGEEGSVPLTVTGYEEAFRRSWVYADLHRARNFGPALHRFGLYAGGAFNWLDQTLFKGKLPLTLRDGQRDYAGMRKAAEAGPLDYPKPDGVLSFDKPSSVFLSNTYHEEDQPVHLRLADPDVPLQTNLPLYNEPAQRYCPAGVYEIVENNGEKRFVINAQNCLHCKTCDIKDPSQNITWVTPEGGGGPNYTAM
ncbi:electron transfer flavoprotein-ubiquinone oxidoreductase [Granulosicoccaceae sp. 1_MG-2023]|nr:electron transfer flavoprotein-ubiquinone oxidoreductase [Granulosicoccaceae sp. 1_MG-2023]